MQHPSRSPPTHIDTTSTTASRFFVSMRNPFSQPTMLRRKTIENTVSLMPPLLNNPHDPPQRRRVAMYSTPEERHAHNSSRASHSHYLDSRPTIEQIAMGLHVSRTPHLRLAPNPLQRHPIPTHNPPYATNCILIHSPSASSVDPHDPSPSSPSRTRHSLPPPPPRSSMKKTSPSVSTLTQPRQLLSSGISPSTSVVTSAIPPTPSRPLSFLRARVSKFIPGYRPLSLPSSLSRACSITSSASDSTRPTTPRKAVRFSTSVLGIDKQL